MEMGTLDIAGAADSLTDIQTYLASFNKEIASPPALSDPTAAQPAAPFLPTSDLNSLFPGGTITVLQNQDGTTQLLLTSNVGESFPKVEPDGSKPVVADVTNVSLSTSDDLLPSTGVFPIIETKTETMVADQMNPQTPALTALDTQISMEQILSPVTPVTALATNSSGSQVIGQSAIFSVSNTTEVTQQPLLVTAPIQTSLQQPGVITVPAMPIQSNQLLINPTNPLQTMTLVPSEIQQDGEVKYVLVVSQQPDATQVVTEEQQSINLDMSIYDFKEDKSGQETKSAATPKKVIKVSPKKTPGGVQAQLMCNYCNYTSPKRYLLTRHMKTHSEERPHKCNICDRGFKTVASLQNHINTHTGIRPHRCKECASAFTTSGELVRHVRYKHTFEKPHKCSECDYSSVELSKLKRHMRSHTGERPFQCPQCTYASPDTYKLKRHLRIHTGEKPYICEICHSRFTQSNSLKSHKLIHTGNKPVFQCELCPTTCGRKTDLKIHVQKLHTSDKPLQCRKCGKSFPDRYTYKIHLKTHDGEKCYRCELCPYAALSQRHLQSHILTHTGEKPYACNECDQSFRQKQLLKRHKNLYHTPDYNPPAPREKVHECSECGRGFAHRGNMLRHMILHDPNNPEYQTLLELENAKMEELDSSQIQYVQILEDEDHPTVKADGSLHQGPVQLQLVSDGTEDAIYLQMGEPGLPSNETTDVLEPKSGVHPKDEDAIQHVILSMPESEQAKLDLSTVEEDIRSVGLSNNVDAKPDGLSDATFFNLNNSDVSESNAVDKAEIQDVPRGDQIDDGIEKITTTKETQEDQSNEQSMDDTPTGSGTQGSKRRKPDSKESQKNIEECFGFDVNENE